MLTLLFGELNQTSKPLKIQTWLDFSTSDCSKDDENIIWFYGWKGQRPNEVGIMFSYTRK